MVARTSLQVGEPVQVRAKLKSAAPDGLTVRIDGAVGLSRYVSFPTPGNHTAHVTVTHADGRRDKTTLYFEVVGVTTSHPYPVLDIRQEPTNPFLLYISLKNVSDVHRPGATYEWSVDGRSTFVVERPYFVVDCDRLLNATDLLIPCDLAVTVVYPDGQRRTAKESFRIVNDYAWQKARGVLQPRLVYDYLVRGSGLHWAASCLMVNDDDEQISITGRQFEILFDDPDRVLAPGPVERLDDIVQPRSQRPFDCSLLRRKLPEGTLGYAVHFHGRTASGLKVEASAYFEHYTYQTSRWSDVTNLYAVDLLNEVKLALVSGAMTPRPPAPRPLSRSETTGTALDAVAVRTDIARPGAAVSAPVRRAIAPLNAAGLTLSAVRNYVDAMRPTWTAAEAATRDKGLQAIFGTGPHVRNHVNDEAWFLGKQCLLDEDPPTDDLFCRGTGKKGKVFVPSRIMNGKKGDVVLLPGGPIGFIGKLLLSLDPPQFFSHCGIMTGNFYKVRHATASEDWLEDELTEPGTFSPDDPGTDGFKPESLKYIWPGTVDQSVDQAFHGSDFLYQSRDGKRKKSYRIQAFSKDPVFFLEHDRHVVFPMMLKPDPLLEGDPDFAHVRPALHRVAEQAKLINGHYRFFCYSDGAISLKDDTAHRAPDRGAAWWASNSRPMVCSTLVLAAVEAVADPIVRLEGADAFTVDKDLERIPLVPGAKAPDADALVDAITRDGMYLYTAAERLHAAEALYDKASEKADAKGGFKGKAFADAPDDVANQICNTFAYDYSGREFDEQDAKDSDKWRTPGEGRSVSPDDMLAFWDAPTRSVTPLHGLYGTAHRMVFRDGKVEERELGTWVIRDKVGKLTVTVTHRDRLIPGADVKVGGRVAVTNAVGAATFDLPEGPYVVEAGVLMNGLFFEGSAPAQAKDRANTGVTIALSDPPEFKRLVVIGGGVHIKDVENIGKDEILHSSFSLPPIHLGPDARQASVPYTRKWGGEIRVEATFNLTWNADLSITVACNVKLYEGTSEDTNDLDGEQGDIVPVPRDAENVPMPIFVRNDQEDDDDHVQLDVLISNFVDY
jgi:hypothetical protein